MKTVVLVLRDDKHKQKALKRIREEGYSLWGIMPYYKGQNLVYDVPCKSRVTTCIPTGYLNSPKVHTIKAFLEAIK